MQQRPDEPATSYDQLSRQQLEIYARELASHIQQERSLRERIEEQNAELENRVKELLALNRIFQQHLEEQFVAFEAYSELRGRVEALVKQAEALGTWLATESPYREGMERKPPWTGPAPSRPPEP